MSAPSEILLKTESYATDILQNQLSKDYVYHNYDHTKGVVKAVQLLGKGENLSQEDLEILEIAAWFHDTGFRDAYHGHEDKSKIIAEAFLGKEGYPKDKLLKVADCILVTKLGSNPQNLLEKIICDADLLHICDKKYDSLAQRLRSEIEQVEKLNYSEAEWIEKNIEFISLLKFSSDFAKSNFNIAKDKTRKRLMKKLGKLNKETDKLMLTELGVTPEKLKELKKKLKKSEDRPERGIETMFKLTSKNHLTLSSMADSKANIMISVNSIIISIIIGALMQKLDNNPHLVIPTIILLAVNLTSMVFAILSIRPNVTKGVFTKDDIENHRVNLLFFGNFHRMKREEYQNGMNRLMESADFLYSSLIDDIYFLGVVLAPKYKLLRYSYNAFMYGIVFAVIAFLISNLFAVPKPI